MAEHRTDKHRIGDGDVPLKLEDGEEMVLKPSWGAAQAISRQYGGISGAVERVVRMDIDVTVQVILLGLGYLGTRKPPTDLAERIWRTGFTDRTGAIGETTVKYLHILANGGKPLPEDGPAGSDGTENPSIRESTNSS
jgi:hypothetical protein